MSTSKYRVWNESVDEVVVAEDSAAAIGVFMFAHPNEKPNAVSVAPVVYTRVQVPVVFEATYDHAHRKISKLRVSPLESDAGYFDLGSSVVDGPHLDLDWDGEFWTAFRDWPEPIEWEE